MIAKVCVNLKTQKQFQLFDYKIKPEQLLYAKVGQICLVDFSGKNKTGIIIQLNKTQKTFYPHTLRESHAPTTNTLVCGHGYKGVGVYKTKSIKKVYGAPVVQKWQIELAKYTAKLYSVSFGKALFSILPDFSKKLIESENQSFVSVGEVSPRTADLGSWQKQFIAQSKLIRWKKIKEIASAAASIVILPEIIQAKILSKFIKGSVLYHSQLSLARTSQIYLDALSGKISIIIGAWSALFVPLKNCQNIIIDDYLAGLYIKDQNPKFDIWEMAKLRAQITGARPIFSDDGYPIFTFKNENFDKSKLSFAITPNIEYGLLKNLEPQKSNFIFFPFNYDFKALVCANCQTVAKCERCQTSLSVNSERKKLICVRCKLEKDIPLICPKCSGAKFKNSSPSIRSFYQSAQKILRDLIILDRDNIFLTKNPRNLISTYRAFSYPLKRFNICHIIFPEYLLNNPDPFFNESLYYLLRKIFNLGEKIIFYVKDNEALAKIQNFLSADFAQKLFDLRKEIGIMPQDELVKISCPKKITPDKIKKISYNLIKQGGEIFSDTKIENGWQQIFKIKKNQIIDYSPCNIQRNYRKIIL